MVPSKYGVLNVQVRLLSGLLIQLSMASSCQHQAILYRQSIERTNVIPSLPKQLPTIKSIPANCVRVDGVPNPHACHSKQSRIPFDVRQVRLPVCQKSKPSTCETSLALGYAQRTLYRRIAINSTFRQIGLLPYTLCAGLKWRTITISLLQRVRVLHVINTNTPLIHPVLYAPIWSRIARCRRGTGSQRGSQ